jgi:hypothetical protein
MYLIPKKGRTVPDPDRGDVLPAAGRNVEPSTYWIRRLSAGDVRKQDNSPAKPRGNTQ